MCRMQKITQVNCPDEDRVEPESTPGVRSILLRATDRKDGADLFVHKLLNRRMPNGTYGGVRGRDWRECPSKVPPTRLLFPIRADVSWGEEETSFHEGMRFSLPQKTPIFKLI